MSASSHYHPEDAPFLPATRTLMGTAVDAVGIDGAAVAILTDDAAARDLLHSTDAVAARLDELQFTLGEGPCLDAFRDNEPRSLPDLDDASDTARWPAFASEVVGELDIRALLACPITVDGAALGVLELYRREAGGFSDAQIDAARTLADAVGITVLSELGTYSGPLDASKYTQTEGKYRFARADVNTAIGMLSVRLNSSVADASAMLRARAYSDSRSICSIAYELVHRQGDFAEDR